MLSQQRLSLFAILILAFFIRAWGVTFGLPDTFHQDEPMMVHRALAMGGGSLNPGYFVIPGLVMYALLLLYGIYYLCLLIAGQVASPEVFAAQFLSDPTQFYLIGRLVMGVALGVITVWIVWRIAYQFLNERIALWSALFLSVAFLHVQNSRYIYADMAMTLFMMWFFYAVFKLFETGKLRDAVISGIALGLAMSTKYNAVLLVLPAILGLMVSGKAGSVSNKIRLIGIAALTATVIFILTNPYIFLDWAAFVQEFQSQKHAHGYQGILYHLKYSLRRCWG